MDWCLNIYPDLRPALSNVYDKLRFQTNQNATIWINNAVQEDLRWALDKIESSEGWFLLKATTWTTSAATHVIFCDACPTGMGFWYPDLNQAFCSETPTDNVSDLIFYFEALCVLCTMPAAELLNERGSSSTLTISTQWTSSHPSEQCQHTTYSYGRLLTFYMRATMTCMSYTSQEMRIKSLTHYHKENLGELSDSDPNSRATSRCFRRTAMSCGARHTHCNPLYKCWGQPNNEPISASGQAALVPRETHS